MDRNQFAEWVVAEILRRKASWLHAVYRHILPPELYDLAKADNELDRVQAWVKQQGYGIRELTGNGYGESRLEKAGLVVAFFRPKLVKEGTETKLAFDAMVGGRSIEFVDPENN